MTLGSKELDGGSTFNFVLSVRNFLGSTSEPFAFTVSRAALPVPLIAIQAPPLLSFPATARVALEARASIADCFASGDEPPAISFSWAVVASTPSGTSSTSPAPLVLDPASRLTRDLYVSGSSLELGVIYTVREAIGVPAQHEGMHALALMCVRVTCSTHAVGCTPRRRCVPLDACSPIRMCAVPTPPT